MISGPFLVRSSVQSSALLGQAQRGRLQVELNGPERSFLMAAKLPDELRTVVIAHPGEPLELIDEQTRVSFLPPPPGLPRRSEGLSTTGRVPARCRPRRACPGGAKD